LGASFFVLTGALFSCQLLAKSRKTGSHHHPSATTVLAIP